MDKPLCRCHQEPMHAGGWKAGKRKWECAIRRLERERSPAYRAKVRVRRRIRERSPAYRAQKREYRRSPAYQAWKRVYQQKWYQDHPEVRERELAQKRERYNSDPLFRISYNLKEARKRRLATLQKNNTDFVADPVIRADLDRSIRIAI